MNYKECFKNHFLYETAKKTNDNLLCQNIAIEIITEGWPKDYFGSGEEYAKSILDSVDSALIEGDAEGFGALSYDEANKKIVLLWNDWKAQID